MYAKHPRLAKKWSKKHKKAGKSFKNLPDKKENWENFFDPIANERLPGGLAAKYDPSQFDQHQLMKGIHVEFEHTNDVAAAMEIAMDHLVELPDYYDRLEKVETEDSGPKVSNMFKFANENEQEEDELGDEQDGEKHSLPFAQSSMRTGR